MPARGETREDSSPFAPSYIPTDKRPRRFRGLAGEWEPAAACGGYFPNLPPIPPALGAGARTRERVLQYGYRSTVMKRER